MTYRGFYNTKHQVWIRTDAFSCLLKLPSFELMQSFSKVNFILIRQMKNCVRFSCLMHHQTLLLKPTIFEQHREQGTPVVQGFLTSSESDITNERTYND